MRVAAAIGCAIFAGCSTTPTPSPAARDFLAACAEPASLGAFAERSYAPSYVRERTMEGLVDADQRVCTRTGGLRVMRTMVDRGGSYFAFARGVTGGDFRIAINTDAKGKIVRRSVASSLTPPSETLVTHRGLDRAALDRYLDALAAADRFSGVVLIGRGEGILYEGARKTAADARFGLASAGKMFTATAVLQLVEQKKLGLSSTLQDVLPDFPNPELGRRITIEQLLTHTSGLPMFFDDLEVVGLYVAGEPLSSFLPRIARLPLEPPLNAPKGVSPHSGHSRAMYSNAGYILLGAVIERVSGLRFDEYLERNIFAPAGMTATVLRAHEHPVANAAPSYTFLGGDGTARRVGCGDRCGMQSGSAAGGGYTTARDLHRFLHALATGRLVSAAAFAAMKTPRTLSPWGTDYGYGLAIERIGATTFIGHAGDFVGTNVDAVTDGELAIVVVSNYERPAATGVADVLKSEFQNAAAPIS